MYSHSRYVHDWVDAPVIIELCRGQYRNVYFIKPSRTYSIVLCNADLRIFNGTGVSIVQDRRESNMVCSVQRKKDKGRKGGRNNSDTRFLQRPLADNHHRGGSSTAPHRHLNGLSARHGVGTVRRERRRAVTGSGGRVGGHGTCFAGHHSGARRGGCATAHGCYTNKEIDRSGLLVLCKL